MGILEQLIDNNPEQEFLKYDGLDDAVIGSCYQSDRLIYSVSKIIDVIVSKGNSYEDAIEYFTYNLAGSYLGEKTPILLNDLKI